MKHAVLGKQAAGEQPFNAQVMTYGSCSATLQSSGALRCQVNGQTTIYSTLLVQMRDFLTPSAGIINGRLTGRVTMNLGAAQLRAFAFSTSFGGDRSNTTSNSTYGLYQGTNCNYGFVFDYDGGTSALVIQYQDGAAGFSAVANSATITYGTSPFRFKYEVIGTRARGKFWLESAAEPDDWQADGYATGAVLANWNANNTCSMIHFGIQANYDGGGASGYFDVDDLLWDDLRGE